MQLASAVLKGYYRNLYYHYYYATLSTTILQKPKLLNGESYRLAVFAGCYIYISCNIVTKFH